MTQAGEFNRTYRAIGNAIAASMSIVVLDHRVKRHSGFIQGGLPMRLSSAIRAALIALTVTGEGLATAAYADSGTIRFNVIKAGFVFGGSGGSGTLVFHGRYYRLAIGGVLWRLSDRFRRHRPQHPNGV